jgi:hypothetical protein
MDEQVKNIVSKYIKVPAEKITADTVIDRSAVASSFFTACMRNWRMKVLQ